MNLPDNLEEAHREIQRLVEGASLSIRWLKYADEQKEDGNFCSSLNYEEGARDMLQALLEGRSDYHKARLEGYNKRIEKYKEENYSAENEEPIVLVYEGRRWPNKWDDMELLIPKLQKIAKENNVLIIPEKQNETF